MTEGWSKKVFLRLEPPSPEDPASLQERILKGLSGSASFSEGRREPVRIRPAVLGEAGEILKQQGWEVTAVLGFDGDVWELLRLEAGDTAKEHYGLCVDLGSTTILMELVDMNTGEVRGRESTFNPQIAFGEDILTRIFYTKDRPEHRVELQKAAAEGLREPVSGRRCTRECSKR